MGTEVGVLALERVALEQNVPELSFTNERLASWVGKTVDEMNALPVSKVATSVVYDALAQSKSSLLPEKTCFPFFVKSRLRMVPLWPLSLRVSLPDFGGPARAVLIGQTNPTVALSASLKNHRRYAPTILKGITPKTPRPLRVRLSGHRLPHEDLEQTGHCTPRLCSLLF